MALLEGDEIIVTYHPSEHNVFPGWYGKIREQCDHQRRSWVEAEGMEAPKTPEPKSFKKRVPEIPTRESYTGNFEPSFWKNWPRKEIPERPETWINKEKLQKEAEMANYDSKKLWRTLSWLADGVELGCVGDARLPTVSSNHPSAFEYGDRITDALRGWIEDGICAGPYTKKELEELGFKDITINSMQVRLKPNGKARIIHDLSSPHHKEEKPPGTPLAVNRGIDKKQYPAKMANTKSVLKLLDKVGAPAEFSKIDWQQAYKHLGK